MLLQPFQSREHALFLESNNGGTTEATRMNRAISTMANDHSGPGHGAKLTKATVIVCGVASLVASLLSFVYVAPADLQCLMLTNGPAYRSIWLQT